LAVPTTTTDSVDLADQTRTADSVVLAVPTRIADSADLAVLNTTMAREGLEVLVVESGLEARPPNLLLTFQRLVEVSSAVSQPAMDLVHVLHHVPIRLGTARSFMETSANTRSEILLLLIITRPSLQTSRSETNLSKSCDSRIWLLVGPVQSPTPPLLLQAGCLVVLHALLRRQPEVSEP
jgi:hypothetical protein